MKRLSGSEIALKCVMNLLMKKMETPAFVLEYASIIPFIDGNFFTTQCTLRIIRFLRRTTNIFLRETEMVKLQERLWRFAHRPEHVV